MKLNNNYEIPEIGYGTWQTPNNESAINGVKSAIQFGYRHIDTASTYGNEKAVGEGILQSGVDRAELFVTSKVWNSDRGYDKTILAFHQSIADLQLEYLDLYLIHWPAAAHQFEDWKEINHQTWKALEDLYKQGLVKSIGISNFLPHHLEPLLSQASILPMVNQIEYHPGFKQEETLAYCHSNHIVVEGWSPIGSGNLLDHPILTEIGNIYGRSVAQICIRWAMQNHVIPLPKSVTPERIIENFTVNDFSISAEHMQIINQIEYSGSGLNPDQVEF